MSKMIWANICNGSQRCLISCVANHLDIIVFVLDKSNNLIVTSVDTLVANGSELQISTMDLLYSLANNVKGVEVGVSLFIILATTYEDLCGTDWY